MSRFAQTEWPFIISAVPDFGGELNNRTLPIILLYFINIMDLDISLLPTVKWYK